MATQHSNTRLRSQGEDLLTFKHLEDYDWDSDVEFQSGLQAILGPNPAAEQVEHLTLRARCFYFARKYSTPLNFNSYQLWRSQQSSSRANSISATYSASGPSPARNSSPRLVPTSRNCTNTALEGIQATAPYPISFGQLVELITNGDPIPGIKEVPDTVLKGQASQPTTLKRKKPWERDDVDADEEFVRANTSVANFA